MGRVRRLADLAGVMARASSGQILSFDDSGNIQSTPSSVSTTVYADMTALIAATGMSNGDQAFVTANNNLYLYSGTGWYKIATVQNDSPSAITGVNGTYSLALNGTPTVITAVSTDPEGFPLTWSYSTSGLGSIATVSQLDNVFTITPSTNDANAGTFTLTINATDGVNGAVSANTSIVLEFIIVNSKYTTLLATAVDTSDNNDITDSSTNNHTITVNGDAQAGTFSPYRHGGYSTYFDGADDYLDIAYDQTIADWSSTDYTIEAWVYYESFNVPAPGSPLIIRHGVVGSATNYWSFGAKSTGELQFYYYNGGAVNTCVSTATLDLNTWHHIVMSHNNTNNEITLYLDGVSVHTHTVLGTPTYSNGSTIIIGELQGTDHNGYITDLRITTSEVHSAAFTPPTERLTAVTNTQLLTCHLPYISDGSSSPHSITVNGNTSTKPFGPYDYQEYLSANHGGSVSMPNDNEYLSVAHSNALKPSGTDPFCVSFWYYPTSSPGTDRQLVGDFQVVSYPSNCPGWDILYQTSGAINARWGYPNYADTGSGITNNIPILNSWNHIVFCRSGGNLSLFLNGKRCNTFTSNISISASGLANFYVGYAGEASGSAMNSAMGTIADFKYEVGTSQFDATASTITVPTAPQSTTNSVLHIKGTDASIIDKSQGANLKLVGNTTGSTTQVKFANTKSMYFDGTGDYITADQIPLGSGDFTIEAYTYLDARLTIYPGIFSNYSTFSAGSLSLIAGHQSSTITNYQVAHNGTFPTINAGPITYDQWVHLCLERYNGTITLYKDGSSVGSFASTVALNGVGSNFYIGALGDAISSSYINGWIQDFRVTTGLARYTSNFTPPAEPLKG